MVYLRLLIYLLIACLPLQIGKHYFFFFSFLSGVRIDYLAPTIYVTDILALGIIGSGLFLLRKQPFRVSSSASIVVSVLFLYLIGASFFVSSSVWISLYKVLKYAEWGLVGYISYRVNISRIGIIRSVSFPLFYSSLISIWQFMIQRSIGGVLWYIGERTFSVSTPGIATMAINGEKVLRSYGTFPHPNVLGGFLSLALLLCVYSLKYDHLSLVSRVWYIICVFLGLISLLSCGSRTAGVMMMVSLFVVSHGGRRIWKILLRHKNKTLVGVWVVIFFGLIVPFVWPGLDMSMKERTALSRIALEQFSSHWMGVGLNNGISPVFPFQPAHNVFLVNIVEMGVLGSVLLLILIHRLYDHGIQRSHLSFVMLILLLGLSMFDHYLVSLQQGMMMTMIMCLLVFLPQNTYTNMTHRRT